MTTATITRGPHLALSIAGAVPPLVVLGLVGFAANRGATLIEYPPVIAAGMAIIALLANVVSGVACAASLVGSLSSDDPASIVVGSVMTLPLMGLGPAWSSWFIGDTTHTHAGAFAWAAWLLVTLYSVAMIVSSPTLRGLFEGD